MMTRWSGRGRVASAAVVLMVSLFAQTVGANDRPVVDLSPLRITGSKVVEGGEPLSLTLGPFRCDSTGNVFYVPVQRREPGRITDADTVVGISSDARTSTRFRVAEGGLSQPVATRVVATALDLNGDLYVLTRTRTDKGNRQDIVSYSRDGKYRSRVEIDAKEIIADNFAVFGSGEFLLAGERPRSFTSDRLAVLSAGAPLRDLWLPAESEPNPNGAAETSDVLTMGFAQTGRDGRIYLVRNKAKTHVYAVSSSGEVDELFELSPPKGDATLSGIQVSGNRLAAIYQIVASDSGRPARHVAVHELPTGELQARYGPISNLVMCYQSVDGFPDRFTLLGMKNHHIELITASP